MNCWRRGEYVGLGPAAHSFEGGIRRSNVASLVRYCEMLERGVLPIDDAREISPEEAVREMVFLGLRTEEGIDLKATTAAFGAERGADTETALRKLHGFLASGLMTCSEGRLILTPLGIPLANPLMVEVMRAVGV